MMPVDLSTSKCVFYMADPCQYKNKDIFVPSHAPPHQTPLPFKDALFNTFMKNCKCLEMVQ